ncbi:hypothetical protein TCSYLVIO_005097 [Trypanosoma cruzi]|nr:hypothetical protein TCSYLVIO_005097 [Trypanosoma cruzi]
MWKQDIGQWVERKGRRGWAKQPQEPQQQQQQQPQQPSVPLSPAMRAGFIPEGFEDRHEKVTFVPESAENGRHLDGKNNEAFSHAGERWVAVYGVLPGSIMDVREFLDVMFGRTVEHYYPLAYATSGSDLTPILAGGQNWFYVKFEDPVSAARAVYQSPLAISLGDGHSRAAAVATDAAASLTTTATALKKSRGGVGSAAKEEVVGVAWCTDARFLRKECEAERRRGETKTFRGVSGDNNHQSPQRKTDNIQNALGVTPRGAERLQRTQPPLSHSESGSVRLPSRGLGSLLYDVLCSPWNGRWTATPSREHASSRMCGGSVLSVSPFSSSPPRTEVFEGKNGGVDGRSSSKRRSAPNEGEIKSDDEWRAPAPTRDITPPLFLYSRGGRHHYYDPDRQIHSALPVRPLCGNESVLSVFRADTAERHILRRVVVFLGRLPYRISRLLDFPSLRLENSEEVSAAADDSQWLSLFGVFDVDWRYQQRRQQLLRNRHYNAAARFLSANVGYGETPVIASWAPYRWYESTTVFSLFCCLFLFLAVFFSGFWNDDVSIIDVESTGRWGNDTTSPSATGVQVTSYDSRKHEAPRLTAGQLQGIMFADGIYGSDRYTARTL